METTGKFLNFGLALMGTKYKSFCSLCCSILFFAAYLGSGTTGFVGAAAAQSSNCDGGGVEQAELGDPQPNCDGGGGMTGNMSSGQMLPASVDFSWGTLVSPESAVSTLGSSLSHTNSTGITVQHSIIRTLANGLYREGMTDEEYVSVAYEYVLKNIQNEFRFGLSKGGVGAVLDQSGTSFDQAHLLVELLRNRGINAEYIIGDLAISAGDFISMVGVAEDYSLSQEQLSLDAAHACELLANGGIPALINNSVKEDCSYNGSVNSIRMLSAWVRADGVNYYPSLKRQEYTQHNPDRRSVFSDCLRDCGDSAKSAVLQGAEYRYDNGVDGFYSRRLNSGAVEAMLNARTRQLSGELKAHDDEFTDLVSLRGGFQPFSGDVSEEILKIIPNATSSRAAWGGDVPDAYRTKMELTFGNMSKTLFGDELSGFILSYLPNELCSRPDCLGEDEDRNESFDLVLEGNVSGKGLSRFVLGTANDGRMAAVVLELDFPYTNKHRSGRNGASNGSDYLDRRILSINAAIDYSTVFITISQLNFDTGQTDLIPLGVDTKRLHPVNISVWLGEVGPGRVRYMNSMASSVAQVEVDHRSCFSLDQNGSGALSCQNDIESERVSSFTTYSSELWAAQALAASKLVATISHSSLQHHYTVGSRTSAVDLRDDIGVDLQSGFSVTPLSSAISEFEISRTLSILLSALEGGIERQLADSWGGFSATRVLAIAGETNDRLFFVNGNFNEVRGRLDHYTRHGRDFAELLFSEPNVVGLIPEDRELPKFRSDSSLDNDFSDAFELRVGRLLVATSVSSTNRLGVSALTTNGQKGATTTPSLKPQQFGDPTSDDPTEIISFNVSASSGIMSMDSPVVLSTGAGEFPYSLSFQPSYQSSSSRHPSVSRFESRTISGPTQPPRYSLATIFTSGLPSGWANNFDFEAELTSNGLLALQANYLTDSVDAITAVATMLDALGSDDLPAFMSSVYVSEWLMEKLENNVVEIRSGHNSETFVRQADNTFGDERNSGQKITVSGETSLRLVNEGNLIEHYPDLKVLLRRSDGSELHFDENIYSVHAFTDRNPSIFNRLDRNTARLKPSKWLFNGRSGSSTVRVDFEYELHSVGQGGINWLNEPQLTRVSNSLGRSIDFSNDRFLTATTDANQSIRFVPVVGGDGTISRINLFNQENEKWSLIYDSILPYEFLEVIEGGLPRPVGPALNKQSYMGAATRLVEIVDPENYSQIRLSYDDERRIEVATNARDQSTHYDIGGYGSEQSFTSYITDNIGHFSASVFDDSGNTVRSVSARGSVALSEFDDLNRQTETRITRLGWPEGAYEARSTQEYDAYSNQVRSFVYPRNVSDIGTSADGTIIDPVGDLLVTTRTFGIPGFPKVLLTETDPFDSGPETINTYHSETGLLRSTSGPSGEYMEYDYNSLGLMETATQSLNDAGETLVTKYNYNLANGNLTSVIADFGNGRENLVTSLGYDAVGNLISVSDPKANLTTAEYDAVRRLDSIRTFDEANVVNGGADYLYDDRGLLREISVLKEGGVEVSKAFYSETGRLVRMQQPSNDFVTYTYNDRDELDTTTDPDGLVTKQLYYPDGLPKATLRGVGTPLEQTEVAFWYDARGELVRHRPAKGNRLGDDPNDPAQGIYDNTYMFDLYGRSTGMVYPDGSSEVMALRVDGLPERRYVRVPDTTPLNARDYVEYFYDSSKRVTGQQEVHVTDGGAIRRTRSMTYDLAGRVLEERETGGSDARDDNAGADEVVTYAYDALSRITSETASGRTVSYQYDDNGNRTQIMWPDGFAVDYEYDTLNRLSLVELANGGFLADYTFDLRSRLKDGMMGNTSLVSFDYNTDSELTDLVYEVSTEAGADESLAWDYLYTAAGRLSQTALLDGFHPEWSPTESTVVSYGGANVLDQYTAVSGRGAIDYDTRGNTISDERGRSYAYDLYNRLTGAVVGGTPIIYDYDVAGRRVGKSVGGEETRFLHAGDMEIAEYDSAGTLLRRYIPGGAVDQRVAMIEGASTVPGAGDIRYYHADRLGNVAALTDGNGRVTDRYAYDPFGNEITGAATSGNPFRYTGRRYDPETGLYFYRARYYDAPLGRFLQTDPIGYADQWNLYTYVGNDPLRFTDPSGQDGVELKLENTGRLANGATFEGSVALAFTDEKIGEINIFGTSINLPDAGLVFSLGSGFGSEQIGHVDIAGGIFRGGLADRTAPALELNLTSLGKRGFGYSADFGSQRDPIGTSGPNAMLDGLQEGIFSPVELTYASFGLARGISGGQSVNSNLFNATAAFGLSGAHFAGETYSYEQIAGRYLPGFTSLQNTGDAVKFPKPNIRFPGFN